MNKFEVRNMDLYYGSFHALKNINIDIPEKEITAFIGPSGCGKSTFLKSLNRMNDLVEGCRISGDIKLDGVDIYKDKMDVNVLRKRVGMVFQNPSAALNPVMTVAQQVGLPLYLHYDLSLTERSERVTAMLAKVGLSEDVLAKYPHELSGGQRQRVGIATALVTSPRLIIADEPTTALDSITQRQIVDLLTSLVDESGASMLFITHDFAVLNRATTRCYVLENGRIEESGDTTALLDHPHTDAGHRLVQSARALSLHAGQDVGQKPVRNPMHKEVDHD